MQPPEVSPIGCIPRGGFYVYAADGGEPSLNDCRRPGTASAWLSHDCGLSWPDRRGEVFLRALLGEGGTAILVFENPYDAELCRAKLLRWIR